MAPRPILRSQGPANVLVVVNRSSNESAAIAEYYVRRRAIPPANVCAIRVSPDETVTREVYEEQIEGPIGACLSEPKRALPIYYLVTTLGVPLRILGSLGQTGTRASVDSELAVLYLRARGKPAPLEGPVTNPFFRKREARFDQRLFPMYLVTRLAAYTVNTVKKMIDRSLAASNRGRFILDMNASSNVPGESWLRDAAILLPASRVLLNRDREVVRNQTGVIGYAAWGSNDKSRKERFLGFHWLPGAIATEFVSTDGRTFQRPRKDWTLGSWSDRGSFHAGSPQSMSADYLEEGATGVSGHVDEPYLGYTPRPDILLPAYYAGRNLAESFYLSMPAISWMNIVLGDPLCSLGPPK
jgi:uncharacterized protein (TIGR03790 family)